MTLDQSKLTQPTSDGARFIVVCALAVFQFGILLWAAQLSIAEATHCRICDTSYYLNAANEIVRSGLLFENRWDGYRSYFVPLVIAGVQRVSYLVWYDATSVERYVYGVSCLFWLVSAGAMWWLSKQVSNGKLLLAASATLVNPFLVVYVPFVLQEGVLIAFCLPLLFVWVGAKNLKVPMRAVLVLLMALIAYVVRASLAWWLLPAIVYTAWELRRHVWQPRRWLPAMSLAVLAGALLLGPQIYISKHKFDTFNPYPATALFSEQIAFGVSLIKFATVEDEGHWRQLAYLSPYVADPEAVKKMDFYLNNPTRAAFLMLGHAYSGFHYDQIVPYWRLEHARALTFWLVLSSAIVFLGVTQMAATVLAGRLDADSAFAIATAALCCASLMFVATEARFGIVGFAMLSIQALKLLADSRTRAQWPFLLPGLLLYVALSFLFNTMLMQNADIDL